MNKTKYLNIEYADYYETYREELLRGFARNRLPLKFCTMFPELLELYTSLEHQREQDTTRLLENLSLTLFESSNILHALPEKKYVVCSLACDHTMAGEHILHILKTHGRRSSLVIQHSSLTSCRQSVEGSKVDWGVTLDMEQHFPELIRTIQEREGEDVAIIFTLLGFTFASLEEHHLLTLFHKHMRKNDRLIVDIPIFNGHVMGHDLSTVTSDHLFSPLFNLDVLRGIIHFYGISKKTQYTFHTEYRERSDTLGGFTKDMMIKFTKPALFHFKDLTWTYDQQESLSLFQMNFFTLHGIQSLFQRQRFLELDNVYLPVHKYLGASLHILAPQL